MNTHAPTAQTAAEFFSYLRSLGVEVSFSGGRLVCSAPKGVLTPELRASLKDWKPQLESFLQASGPSTLSEIVAEPETSSTIPVLKRTGPLPASFAQERLYFLHQLNPDSSAYNIGAYFRLSHRVSTVVMESSLEELTRRHEILRTSFGEHNGVPVQLVAQSVPIQVPMLDLSPLSAANREEHVQRIVRDEVRKVFDLSTAPLFRVLVLQLGPEDAVLVLTLHHIICDAWSVGIFAAELHEIYQAVDTGSEMRLPALPLQYGDFAQWQRDSLGRESLQWDAAYWRQKLSGCPPILNLPADFPRPPVQRYEGSVVQFSLPSSTSMKLKTLAAREHASAFMALLTIFKILLSRYSRQSDIVVGTPVDGRRLPELERLIGLFVNTVALRTELNGSETGREILRRVRETVLEAHEHSALPFEKVLEAVPQQRSLSVSPIFQTAFVLQNTLLSSSFETVSVTSKFDLSLYMWDSGETFGGAFEYSTELFRETTIERMKEHFLCLAESLADDPDLEVGLLPMVQGSERERLLASRNTTSQPFPERLTVHEWFEQQATARANSVAVVCGTKQLTYGELSSLSNRLAHRLRALGVRPGQLIGVCVDRSLEMPVSLLGILKAGAAYVPLDAQFPEDRLVFMLKDAEASVLVTQEHLVSKFSGAVPTIVCLDTAEVALANGYSEPVRNTAGPDDLAYVIYTSGSSGKPKGVEIRHRSVVNFLTSMRHEPGLSDTDILLSVTTISFDIAGLELYLPLVNGAQVVIATRETLADPGALIGLIEHCGATVMQATPVTWRMLLDAQWKGSAQLKILCGGEALPRELAARLVSSGRELWNLYGPTETTIWSTVCRVTAGDGPTPIGKPIANTTTYVLDEYMQPVPTGVPGELYIGGEGLARGYWHRPELTAQRFVPNPFCPEERLYRTGDLVRWREDGNLEYITRLDQQIKLRGHRIELEEIERALEELVDVCQAVVMVRNDVSGGPTLVAYLNGKESGARDSRKLRQALMARLPDYMIPAIFVWLDEFPLTPNKKVDRQALPAPDAVSAKPVLPRNNLETQVLTIWKHVLELDGIGIYDDFFELGGNSLRAIKLFAQLSPVFGKLPLSLLFECPTVAQMAAKLEAEGFNAQWKSLVAIQPNGSKPPLFIVPGVHGNVLHCTTLARCLGSDRRIYGLQSVGLDSEHSPLETIEEIAGHFVDEIQAVQEHGPYHLAGICTGGVVAFEIAQRLRAQGEAVATLVMVDTWTPATVRPTVLRSHRVLRPLIFFGRRAQLHFKTLAPMNWWERMHYLSDLGRVTADTLRNGRNESLRAEMVEQGLIEANYSAVSRYRPRPYEGTVILVLAESGPSVDEHDPRLSWAKLAKSGATVHKLAADNAGVLMREPMVGALARCLLDTLDPAPISMEAAHR